MANPLLAFRSALFDTGASEAVTYTPPGAGPVPVPDVRAVRSGDYAGSLSALGNPLRGVSFEIPRSALPAMPAKNGTLTTAEAQVWRISGVTSLEHVDSWLLTVELAS